MTAPPSGPGGKPGLTTHYGLFTPELRRDLADLNGQYLELGPGAGPGADPRFAWSEPVRVRLSSVDVATRAKMASVPFALFRLVLPPEGATGARGGGIADLPWPEAEPAWQGRCLSFAHQAAFFARRLLDGAPLAATLVLDLAPQAQSLLARCCPSEIASAAAHPGLIRPRWPGHLRFWEWLEAAARSESESSLQWANCMAVCQLGADSDDGADRPAPGRDPPRRPRR